MKLLVFSDTHGAAKRMPAVVAQHPDANAVIFLGDGAKDADTLAEQYPDMPLYRAAGNCDYASFTPLEGLAPFGGLLVFYTHGHNYGVKNDLADLFIAAKSRGADIALFGHTHAPHFEYTDGVYLFNPGSLSIPRGSLGPTYGIITIKDGKPSFETMQYEDGN